MRTILYYFKKFNKYNGSLFYCFEYFIYSKKLNPNVVLIIYNISDDELNNVINLFKNKYEFDHSLLDDLKTVNSIVEIYSFKAHKYLIFDIFTFKKLYYFLNAEILCYSNEEHEMKRSDNKKITYYGYYHYQNYDYQTKLKLNFEIFKPLRQVNAKNIFLSSPLDNYKEFDLPKELKHLKPILKDKNSYHENMYELFESVYYYHSARDTNNRLIPECFYYKKKIYIEYKDNYTDSIYHRYTDILSNGLGGYTLDQNDIMLRDFLI